MSITMLNYFTYANSLKKRIEAAFPQLNTVSWMPTADMGAVQSQYSDLAKPAFLMAFAAPDTEGYKSIRKGVDVLDPAAQLDSDDAGDYYMGIGLNVVGYLIVPMYPEANADVPNTNAVFLTLTAAGNLAAFISSKAGGLGGAGVAEITGIDYIGDDETPNVEVESDYHVAEITWKHSAYVGNIPTDECAIALDEVWAWLNPDWDGDENPDVPLSERTYTKIAGQD